MRKLVVALQFSLVLVIAVALPKPGSTRGFDPQPDPPRVFVANQFSTGFDEVALNPQPLPPRYVSGFDPQPEPPGTIRGVSPQPIPPGTIQGFNPQPDPPHDPFFVGEEMGDGSV
jgi:hypothetical protein